MHAFLDGMCASCSNVDIGSNPLTTNCRNIYTGTFQRNGHCRFVLD